jgi:hypothetical protein
MRTLGLARVLTACGIAIFLSGECTQGADADNQGPTPSRNGGGPIISEKDAESQAVARLQQLGVKITLEETPRKAAVEADFGPLREEDCSNKDLALVRQLTLLRSVELNGMRLTDNPLIEQFATLKKLDSVTLICTFVNDVGVQRLSEVDSLRELRLLHCSEISDHGLCHLKKLKNLEVLSVRDTIGAGDAWLADLQGRKLRDLDLSGTCVSDKGVHFLRKFAALEELRLYLCDVTDECLPDLRAMPKLRTVTLEHTKVTEAGVEALRKSRPDMRIYH